MVAVNPHAPETRGGNIDVFFEITLDRIEVNTLDNEVTRSAIAAACVLAHPVLGAILAVYINEHINVIRDKSGANGALIKTTIRNGNQRREFDVWPL